MHERSLSPITVPRLYFTGTHHGVGVSTVVLGLIAALRRLGIGTGAAKVGPSFAEPTHYRRVMGRLAYTLDPWILDESHMLASLVRLSGGTDLAIFEGSLPLFDSLGSQTTVECEAALAELLGAPIVLVVDARGADESLAAAVHGFNSFRSGLSIAGVIANRIRDPEQNLIIREAIEALGGPVYLGGIAVGDPHQTGGTLAGIQIHNPSALTRNRVIGTGNLVEQGLDLTLLRQVASTAREVLVDHSTLPRGSKLARIAVADDQAFHLTAQDNLDLIRRAGGDLIAFSPIADRRIPLDTSALYLPGGYVHLYAPDLAANQMMLEAIRQFVASGGIVYAEGAAVAYLSRRAILYNGTSLDMVGVLPAVATATTDDSVPSLLAYESATALQTTPITREGYLIRGTRDTRWSFRLESPVPTSLSLQDRYATPGEIPIEDGFRPAAHVIACRSNLHWGSCPAVATTFVEAAAAVKQRSEPKRS